MLIGRADVCGRIDGLLADSRAGKSGVLVIRGEPGIGKSSLLAYAAERAEGMRVLRTVGVEAESELPFSGVHELVLPVLDLLPRLPEAQADALRSALALGPPGEAARFAVYAATLGLLAAAAARQPLLCLVDDAQWLDQASADALLFTCRRLQAEGIVVLFAAREGDPRRFEAPGLPDLPLAGLDREAALALLARGGEPLADEVAERLVELTAGNPLGLLELPRALSHAQLTGGEALADPLPVGETIARAFLRELDVLSPGGRRALVVAAASDTGELVPIVRALARLDLGEQQLGEAESAGFVEISDGRLAFRHPLLRSAVYQRADPRERRAAHAALARALAGGLERAQRAWHLAAASVGPDEDVAALLEEVAGEARSRGASRRRRRVSRPQCG